MEFPTFAFALAALMSASCVGFSAGAVQGCNPSYEIKYSSCITPESPTVIRNFTTDWILVNEGATRITDGICTDHIKVIAQEHPKASNIKFVELEDRPAPLRGWGKRDVYCKFALDEPTQQPIESPACGIQGVERQGCAERLSIDFLQRCLNAPTSTDEDLWKKAACLVDSYKDVPHISHLDTKTYEDLHFQLSILKNRLAKSLYENERRISNYVREHFKE